MNPIIVRATALALFVTCLAAMPASSQSTPMSATKTPTTTRAQLPDSALLAKVDSRVVRVADFRDRYFGGDPSTRPGQDSTGRVEFLQTLVNREVLGLTAKATGRPLTLENRMSMREYTNTTIATQYYRHRVEDPVKVTQADLKAVYPQYSYELKLRYLQIGDQVTAERVAQDLKRGAMTWSVAATRYSTGPDSLRTGDLGWVNRTSLGGPATSKIFALMPATLSQPIRDVDGYRIWQCLDRRPVAPPPFAGIRISLTQELRVAREIPLRDRLFDEASALASAQWDTVNIAWLAKEFVKVSGPLPGDEGKAVLDLTSHVPRLAPADTGRVLAVVHGRPFTAHQMIDTYSSVHGVFRRKILGIASLFDIVQRMTLEPDIVTLAARDGYDKSPSVTSLLDERREGMLVDQMYTDSVLAHVRVTDKMRRQIYEKNRKYFVTPDRLKYGVIVRGTEAGADSVMKQLAKGVTIEQIAFADSVAGLQYQAIREQSESESGGFRDILFAELKPGESTKLERTGGWVVIHLIGPVPSRPQTYDEVEEIVDEAAQSQEAERLLDEWLGRLRPHHKIEAHPERVMQFSMTEATPDIVAPQD